MSGTQLRWTTGFQIYSQLCLIPHCAARKKKHLGNENEIRSLSECSYITHNWQAGLLVCLQWSDLIGGLCVRLKCTQGEALGKPQIPLSTEAGVPRDARGTPTQAERSNIFSHHMQQVSRRSKQYMEHPYTKKQDLLLSRNSNVTGHSIFYLATLTR